MNRYLELIITGIFTLIASILAVWSWFSDAPTSGRVVTTLAGAVMLVIFILVTISLKKESENITLNSGIIVKLINVDVSVDSLNNAVDYFTENYCSKFLKNKQDLQLKLSEQLLKLRIYLVKDPIGKTHGIQKRYTIAVRYGSGFNNNAFFHELAHFCDEMVLDKEPDYEHKNLALWKWVKQLRKGY